MLAPVAGRPLPAAATTSSAVGDHGTSVDVRHTAGTWRPAGADVRVTAAAAYPTGVSGADTPARTARGDGGLESAAAVTPFGAWVWQRR